VSKPTSNLATAEQMIAHYNAQDVDAYVALMTEDAAEASYRGAVLREGREGIRSGLAKTFAEFPENRAEIIERQVLGDYVMFLERVWRTAAGEPFDVLAIYSFEGDKCSRVEFIR
jgi:uncharacterized protein (TIGR02246 family)